MAVRAANAEAPEVTSPGVASALFACVAPGRYSPVVNALGASAALFPALPAVAASRQALQRHSDVEALLALHVGVDPAVSRTADYAKLVSALLALWGPSPGWRVCSANTNENGCVCMSVCVCGRMWGNDMGVMWSSLSFRGVIWSSLSSPLASLVYRLAPRCPVPAVFTFLVPPQLVSDVCHYAFVAAAAEDVGELPAVLEPFARLLLRVVSDAGVESTQAASAVLDGVHALATADPAKGACWPQWAPACLPLHALCRMLLGARCVPCAVCRIPHARTLYCVPACASPATSMSPGVLMHASCVSLLCFARRPFLLLCRGCQACWSRF